MHLQRIQSNAPLHKKRCFDELISSVFGFTFEPWYARGWWTPDYTVYALVEGETLLSSAAIYRMELVIDGKQQTWLQIGAVATRPECRGHGLSRRLMETILAEHPDTPIFLCANASVLDFYPRYGFRRIFDQVPSLRLSGQGIPTPLEPFSLDDSRVWDLLCRRAGFSSRLDCLNAAPIQAFHLLAEHAHHLYGIPDRDILVIAEQEDNVLRLLDVCAAGPVTFTEILPHLHFPGADTLCFGFNPDWLVEKCEWAASPTEDGLFVRGDFPLAGYFILPEFLKT